MYHACPASLSLRPRFRERERRGGNAERREGRRWPLAPQRRAFRLFRAAREGEGMK